MANILLSDLFIEILGALTGLIYLYFSIRRSVWLWPLGLITALFYIYVFFNAKFYAGFSLQFYYLGISIYGWFYWTRGKKENQENSRPVVKANFRELLVFIMIIGFLTLLSGYALDNYTDSPLPYWDAFTTAGGIVATWMLARKYLEHWLFWIVIDLVSLGTYVYKELYPTVILFAAYTIMAIVGYYQWKKAIVINSGH